MLLNLIVPTCTDEDDYEISEAVVNGGTIRVRTHPNCDMHGCCPILHNDTSGIDVIWSDNELKKGIKSVYGS